MRLVTGLNLCQPGVGAGQQVGKGSMLKTVGNAGGAAPKRGFAVLWSVEFTPSVLFSGRWRQGFGLFDAVLTRGSG